MNMKVETMGGFSSYAHKLYAVHSPNQLNLNKNKTHACRVWGFKTSSPSSHQVGASKLLLGWISFSQAEI